MRGLVQRVTRASVSVGDELVSSIGRGICVLVGISRNDTPADAEWLVRKLLNLRIFDDEKGVRWNSSVSDQKLEVLCVSQFTLYGVLKGNKPDFHNALAPEVSEEFYNNFVKLLRKQYDTTLVKEGRFGTYMQVQIQNDGPVTIDLESPPECAKQYEKQLAKEEKRRQQQAKAAAAQKAKQASAKASGGPEQSGGQEAATADTLGSSVQGPSSADADGDPASASSLSEMQQLSSQAETSLKL